MAKFLSMKSKPHEEKYRKIFPGYCLPSSWKLMNSHRRDFL